MHKTKRNVLAPVTKPLFFQRDGAGAAEERPPCPHQNANEGDTIQNLKKDEIKS